MLRSGFLHARRYDGEIYDLMFGPTGTTGTGGAMRPRRFLSREALQDFLKSKIGLTTDAQNDLLRQLASKGRSSLPDVLLSDEQRSDLGL